MTISQDSQATTPAADARPLNVVGVGSSAGGLEALQQLLAGKHVAPDIALVMVQHLDPNHESLLAELLGRHARMPMEIVEHGMAVRPGRGYLIPPGQALEISGGRLLLSPFEEPRGQRRPIDQFLESLARDCGERAAAVILSGTGSDGAAGVRAIKEAGGLVFAQALDEAKYSGMPQSALDTGAVDLALPAAEIIAVATEYFVNRRELTTSGYDDEQFIERVAKHLFYRTGHDVSHYKPATLMRRIARRMSVVGARSSARYVQHLMEDGEEAQRLLTDILINVTEFFRDRAAFDALQRTALTDVLTGKGAGDEVRIWSCGCSSGEETYTLGMLVLETLDRVKANPKVSVFGTDIDEDALHTAREGRYTNAVADQVPREYLERYFEPTPEGYVVGPGLRKIVRFSTHSMIKDPPFSRLDLIVCRNVVIYFDAWLQGRVMPLFHYALAPGGYLFLGPSENLGGAEDTFEEIDGRAKIYRRAPGRSPPLNLPFLSPSTRTVQVEPASRTTPAPTSPEQVYDRLILGRHVPAYAVLNRHREIIYSGGPIGRFLELAPGRARLNIVEMVRGDLRDDVRGLLAAGVKADGEPRTRSFEGRIDGRTVPLLLVLEPLPEGKRMLVFQDRLDLRRDEENALAGQAAVASDDAYVRELERELETARQVVRTTVEELETSNEELKSSNEEMMSMNEELQSANEELSVVNDELKSKVDALNLANADLSNTIDSLQIGMIFLDAELAIRSFTPEAAAFFRFKDHDLGRPLADIRADFAMDGLLEAARRVLRRGSGEEVEVSTFDAAAELQVRVLPYRKADGVRDGVVLTFIPVTEMRQAARRLEATEAEARRQRDEIEQIYRVSPQAMGLLDAELRYVRLNDGLARINGITIEEHIGHTMLEIVPDLSEQVIAPAREVLETGKALLAQSVVGETAAAPGEAHSWEVDWYPIMEGDTVHAVGVNVRDVTKYIRMDRELRRVMLELQHRVKNMLANVMALINRARREEGDPKRVMADLVSRIQALANTHNLLTSRNWEGAELRALLLPELVAVYGEERIHLRGPEIQLNAKAVLAVSMAIHELATNAAKYGALSNDEGQLSVSWSRIDEGEGEVLVLKWKESDGPPVTPPARKGFGSTLIHSTIADSLSGEVNKTFHADGVELLARIPMTSLRDVPIDASAGPV